MLDIFFPDFVRHISAQCDPIAPCPQVLTPTAQYYLSILYRLGLGVEQDEGTAFHWCKKAADEGVLDAQYILGVMYLQGEGVEEDDALALEWLWKAADRGHQQAKEVLQFTLENDFTTGC